MSSHFEAERDCPIIRKATRAFIEVFLEESLPALRLAARGCGYTLTIHGSLSRDIDMVAIPWVNGVSEGILLDRLLGVLAGICGRAVKSGDPSNKPHGRIAYTIYLGGSNTPYLDLSIMPTIKEEPKITEEEDAPK